MIVISACCFGSLTTLTLLAIRAGLALVNVIAWRFLVSAVLLVAITARSRSSEPVGRTAAFRLLAVGGLAQALISYLSFKALDYLPVGVLAFLFYTYPAWVVVISALRGTEPLTKPRFVALILATSGIGVMIGAPAAESLNSVGVAIALATAFLYALYLPALHAAQRGLSPLVSTFYLVAGIASTFLVVSVSTGAFRTPGNSEAWMDVMLLAVVGTVIAFGSMIAGLRVLGPVRTSIVSTVEPFFTALLGVFILGEKLTLAILAGGAMIATAVIFLELSNELSNEPTEA